MTDNVVIGIIVFAMIVVLGIISGCVLDNSCSLSTTKIPIASISDSFGVGGQFALGFGSVGSYPVYYFYEGTAQSGFKLKSIPADGTIIYNDENVSPYITETHNECSKDTRSFYTVHIPENAIKKEYNLNGV